MYAHIPIIKKSANRQKKLKEKTKKFKIRTYSLVLKLCGHDDCLLSTVKCTKYLPNFNIRSTLYKNRGLEVWAQKAPLWNAIEKSCFVTIDAPKVLEPYSSAPYGEYRYTLATVRYRRPHTFLWMPIAVVFVYFQE